MEMEQVGWKEEVEVEVGWAGHGRRPESEQGDVVGRWEKQTCRWN